VEKPQLSLTVGPLFYLTTAGCQAVDFFLIVFTYIKHATCGEEAAESERDTC
jgi:hypothetical protein